MEGDGLRAHVGGYLQHLLRKRVELKSSVCIGCTIRCPVGATVCEVCASTEFEVVEVNDKAWLSKWSSISAREEMWHGEVVDVGVHAMALAPTAVPTLVRKRQKRGQRLGTPCAQSFAPTRALFVLDTWFNVRAPSSSMWTCHVCEVGMEGCVCVCMCCGTPRARPVDVEASIRAGWEDITALPCKADVCVCVSTM